MTRSTPAQLGLELEKVKPLKPSAEKVYRMLQQAGERGITSAEFANAFVLRYAARILELRRLGLEISTERIEGRSQARYVLKREAA